MKRLPRHKKLAQFARQRRHARGLQRDRRIRVTFSSYTSGGDEDEHGWIDKEGSEIELDEYDREEGVTIAKKAAKFLSDEGAYKASSSHFHRGTWYSTDYDQNYRTGEQTQKSYHLDGFSANEEREIFNLVTKRR
jgi:hypothetical protein